MEYNSCELIILPKRYFYTRFTFGVQKDSPYLELINYHLLKMAERGVSAQISKTYEPQTQACPDYTGTALGFHSLIFPFLVIMCGALISLVIGVLEYVSKEIKKQGDQELPPQIVSTNKNVEDQPSEEEKRSLSIVLQDVEVHSDSTLELN